MRPAETTARLAGFSQRGAGTDSERRAAAWLARELPGAQIEPFWCRPNWPLAHAWHAALGLAGSLLTVASPRIGGVLLVLALLSVVADDVLGVSPGRRLTPERASQNVIVTAPEVDGGVRLLVTANYDAGRLGLVYRDPARRAAAWLRRRSRGLTPGWIGWLAIVFAWLIAVAVLRGQGAHGTAIGLVQLPPTVALVLALAALIDLATAPFGPAAGDNATGAAAAVAVVQALAVARADNLVAELVLQGAGDGMGIGLRRHLRTRRRNLKASNTVVLGLAACGAGSLRWWVSDGALVPLRYFGRLRALCARVAEQRPASRARAAKTRGNTPALPARAARLPAICVGCLDEADLAPGSHQPSDNASRLHVESMDATVEFALMLVDEIDAYLASRRRAGNANPSGLRLE